MSIDAGSHLKDHKESQNKFIEVIGLEKQLWALIHSKGLLHTEVQALYGVVRSTYEEIILNDFEEVELQNVEYCLWKLHYKHIDEFRKRIRQNSASSEIHMERFKLFISQATEFYQDLINKLRGLNGLSSDGNLDISGTEERNKVQKCQFSCHRFLVCLGDLARYRELCKKMDLQRLNWSVAANYYFKATLAWPDSGNPHNQLALLATYVGDDFLALYHCIRSLAVREPFPDAWNNLILLFEKNKSSNLSQLFKESEFNFSNPRERATSLLGSKSSNGNSLDDDGTLASEQITPAKTCLWPLFVRMMSFFFTESSLEEFPCTFASTVRELDVLLALDDSDLAANLEPYQSLDSARKGPYRPLQMVCSLIFVVNSLTLLSTQQKDSLEEKNCFQHQPKLVDFAISSTFICISRLIERCQKGTITPLQSPLLPSVLVFVEWFYGVMDRIEAYVVCDDVRSGMSYFVSTLVDLLNQINGQMRNSQEEDSAFWEDYELRGFSPLSYAHEPLNFRAGPATTRSRGPRVLRAAMKIVEKSGNSEKLFFYDNSEKRFRKYGEVAESNSDPHYEEEEVILFRPLTRYNSEPIWVSGEDEEKPTKTPSFPMGPPSLSSWVIDRQSSTIEKEKAKKDFFKPGLSPIEEVASASLTGLFIGETENVEAQTSYSTPTPSAPLLPEDAAWYNGKFSKEPDGILGAPPRSNSYTDWLPPIAPLGLSPTIPGPPLLSSSEWLHQYASQNLGQLHLYGPGSYYGNDGSRFELCDRWGNPLSSNRMVYLESPQVHLGTPLVYGGDERRRERLFHNYYQRPRPYGCGGGGGGGGGAVADLKAEQPAPLLHYLKEKEWQLQSQKAVRGPPYMGN